MILHNIVWLEKNMYKKRHRIQNKITQPSQQKKQKGDEPQAAGKKNVEIGIFRSALTRSTDCWRNPNGSLHFSISVWSPPDAPLRDSSIRSERSLITFLRCWPGTNRRTKVPDDLKKGRKVSNEEAGAI